MDALEYYMLDAHGIPPAKQWVIRFKTKADGDQAVAKIKAHDDLVKALKVARSHIETYGAAADDEDGTKLTPQAAEAIAEINAALAIAGAA